MNIHGPGTWVLFKRINLADYYKCEPCDAASVPDNFIKGYAVIERIDVFNEDEDKALYKVKAYSKQYSCYYTFGGIKGSELEFASEPNVQQDVDDFLK
jgi:hypothetical protein